MTDDAPTCPGWNIRTTPGRPSQWLLRNAETGEKRTATTPEETRVHLPRGLMVTDHRLFTTAIQP
ncbi:hypothetical protein [Nocardiopsis synnemataformans]|uniref:hypothetical protein n=1 Tax=Nocardiopsis synnemataformans TaxID=61305 RepID=UPI003EBBF589